MKAKDVLKALDEVQQAAQIELAQQVQGNAYINNRNFLYFCNFIRAYTNIYILPSA